MVRERKILPRANMEPKKSFHFWVGVDQEKWDNTEHL